MRDAIEQSYAKRKTDRNIYLTIDYKRLQCIT